MVSAKKVENVVSPPRKPVTTKSRIAGGKPSGSAALITAPIMKPPSKFALSVPRGTVGKTGSNQVPKPQRSHAPAAAPIPTAKANQGQKAIRQCDCSCCHRPRWIER